MARGGGQAAPMSLSEKPNEKKKLPLAKLAVVAGVCAVIAGVVLYWVGWRTAMDEVLRIKQLVLERVAAAGPGVFFAAMAVLPAFGMPMLTFALTAGPLFTERMGFVPVAACGVTAITFNLTVTYWLARRWLRPWLTRMLEKYGYKLPQVERDDITDLIVLLRVTPGVPFFVQNYLLGLAEAPFVRYLLISCGVQWSFNVAFMFFGEALNQGRGKMVMMSIMALAALTVGTHLLRKHFGKKKAAAAAAL